MITPEQARANVKNHENEKQTKFEQYLKKNGQKVEKAINSAIEIKSKAGYEEVYVGSIVEDLLPGIFGLMFGYFPSTSLLGFHIENVATKAGYKITRKHDDGSPFLYGPRINWKET